MAWALSFLQGRTRRPPPGRPPSTPRGPAHRRRSAVAFQVPGEPGGGGPGCRGPGRGGRSSCPSSSGTCGPPYRSPRTPGAGAARGRPSGVPDRFLGAAARGRSPDRSGPSPGSDTGGCRPPTSLPGLLAAGAPLDQAGTRDSGPGGPGGGAGSLSAGPRPGGPCSRMTERTVSGLVSTPLRARAA